MHPQHIAQSFNKPYSSTPVGQPARGLCQMLETPCGDISSYDIGAQLQRMSREIAVPAPKSSVRGALPLCAYLTQGPLEFRTDPGLLGAVEYLDMLLLIEREHAIAYGLVLLCQFILHVLSVIWARYAWRYF